MATLKTWLRTCDHLHTCVGFGPARMPDRVIQIVGDTLFLRENLAGKFNYACLSHCWGVEGPNYKLTRSNRCELLDGFEVRDLPKTFREAVEVCIRVGIEYLWIDALCECCSLVSTSVR